MSFDKSFWRPNKKQEQFLALPTTIKEAFYGGGAGSGKSDVLLVYGIVHRWHENSMFKQVFLRRTFPELRNEGMPRGIGHCLQQGQVLTPRGWVEISSFNIGDLVYEVNPQGQLEESVVEQVYAHNYNGKLAHAKISNLDIICTPKHSIARKTENKY